MQIITYLSISTAILLLAFIVLLILSSARYNQKERDKVKKSHAYNASVIKKQITSSQDGEE